jgi:hypothetical protein
VMLPRPNYGTAWLEESAIVMLPRPNAEPDAHQSVASPNRPLLDLFWRRVALAA